MRIAYIVNWDITKNDGVTKKILAQAKSWERLGCECRVFAYVPETGNSVIEEACQYKEKSYIETGLVKNKKIIKDIERYSPGIIYLRYHTWSSTIAYLMRRYKSVCELNTLDVAESKSLLKRDKNIKGILRYIVYSLLRGRVLSKTNAIIGVSKEITEHPSNTKYGKPSIFIPNSIDSSNFKTIKGDNNAGSGRTGLFFMGTPCQPWHGVDIIEKLACFLPAYDFHVIGMDGKNKSNIYWHGYLPEDKYIEILRRCHICVGSLGLYRIGIKEASPLKVREYLSCGYPVIIGYEDAAFINEGYPDWILKLDFSANEELTSNDDVIAVIREFIERNKDRVLTDDEIKKFIDASAGEEKRIKFLEKIINL